MAVRVLVVEDSWFFRRRLTHMLGADPDLEVIGTAVDGREAVDKVMELKPDVVTMDVAMPVMDGIAAVRRIMARQPTPILMFSSLTHEGARATFEALEAGALDFLPKRMEDIAQDRTEAARQLCARVRALGLSGLPRVNGQACAQATAARRKRQTGADAAAAVGADTQPQEYKIAAIGASTGGPVALQQVISELPKNFSLPILLVQHMPGTFTQAFADRLNELSAIRVKQAADGDVLAPGTAYLAPGGMQMTVQQRGSLARLQVFEGDPNAYYRPSVDVTFSSLARAFPGRALAVVLTGMGSDGCEGARSLKQTGGTVWAQDEETSVVYGMPLAVAKAGLADRILPLSEVATHLTRSVQ